MAYKSFNPYIHTASGAYIVPSYSGPASDFLKFDILLGGMLYNAALRAEIHASDPNVKILYYHNLNNAYAGDYLANVIAAQPDPEQYYVNASGAVVQENDMQIARQDGQRIFSYYGYTNIKVITSANPDTDTFTCASHGYSDGWILVFWGADMPSPLAQMTNYYVVNKTADTFQVSLTAGGDPLDITDAGSGTYRAARNPNTDAQNVSNMTGYRWYVDFTSADNRDFLVNNMPTLGSDYDGYFIDNWGPCGAQIDRILTGTVDFQFGSKTGPYECVSGNAELEAEQRKLMTALVAKVVTTDGLWLGANTATYSPHHAGPTSVWRDYTAAGGGLTYNTCNTLLESRGVLEEFLYNVTGLYGDINAHYTVNADAYAYNGSPEKYCHLASWNPDVTASGISKGSDRMILFMLGTHLLYQFGGSYFMYQDVNNDPVKNYIGAMSAQIGDPTGSKSSVDSRTYQRLFTNGIVIVRFRTASGDNYTDSSSYDLGGSYYPVNGNGTLSSPVSSVILANTQGFIGLNAGSTPTELTLAWQVA